MMPLFKRLHVLDHVALFVCGVLAGVLSGGAMNAFNAWLSPTYFGWLFYYPGGSPSWTPQELYWHSVKQGLLEGFVFGSVMAAVFTLFVFVLSRASCRFRFAAPHLLKMVAVGFLFWALGGLNGVLLALAFPQFLSFIIGFGGTPADRLKVFWVGGSIYGSYFGSLISVIMGCFWFRRGWERHKRHAQSASPTD